MTKNIPSGDDVAAAALGTATGTTDPHDMVSAEPQDEAAASDQLAQTLSSLQNLIERNARELQKISDDLKETRDTLRNIFENDTQLSEAEEQAKVVSEQVKVRKSQLQGDQQVTQLKVNIGELTEMKKDVEETLSGELVSYYQLTSSTSFDTSDGDQWEFAIKARVKPRKAGKTDENF